MNSHSPAIQNPFHPAPLMIGVAMIVFAGIALGQILPNGLAVLSIALVMAGAVLSAMFLGANRLLAVLLCAGMAALAGSLAFFIFAGVWSLAALGAGLVTCENRLTFRIIASK